MLMALLLPDPCDVYCPEEFNKAAREVLLAMRGRPQRWDESIKTDQGLRKIILEFIGDFSNWDNSSDPIYLDASRRLVKLAYPDETPLVVDPFAGGGSIPLEALRIGCDAFASDLNPVACLILKVMLEDIPRHGPQLADELRQYGGVIKMQAEKILSEFYPKDPDGATPIAYLWARTIKCESPNCGAEIPLVRSYWLCKKVNRRRALRYRVVNPKGEAPHVAFEVFEPKNEREVLGGNIARAKATCLCCGTVLPPERVREQLVKQRGGADVVFDSNANRIGSAQMLAVVTLRPGEQGRHYRLPTAADYKVVWKAQRRLNAILDEWKRGDKKDPDPIPAEPTPAGGGSGAGRAFSVQKYGMMQWSDLFTSRQIIALLSFSSAIRNLNLASECIRDILAQTLSHVLDRNTSLCRWRPEPYMETVENVYGRQALPMVWDFAEAVPLTESTGSFSHCLRVVSQCVESAVSISNHSAQVQIADATGHPLPDETSYVWFTDPPYYDAVPYADLSDFFLVWLKRVLPLRPMLNDPFDPANPLSPKTREAVQDETKRDNGRPKDRAWFEETMAAAFAEGRRVLREDGVGSVVFAHKTTEGWEALLSGMIRGGWTITGSWPIATEMASRMRARDSAALATSIHLVCRPRPDDAPVGDWGEVLRELPDLVGDWMERLQGEGIRGADLVFACIGPALEIFSRYAKVETAEGREVKLAGYLEKVWEVVGRIALEQVLGTAEARARNGMAGVLEEDARLTALFLWTLQSTNGQNGSSAKPLEEADEDSEDEEDDDSTAKGKAKGYSLVFDVVRRFAQPLGIDLPKWEGRVIETKKGVVRLMAISERARQLFGEAGAAAAADLIEDDPSRNLQQVLFPEMEANRVPRIRGRGRHRVTVDPSAVGGDAMRDATTLDRVHAAMLLQAGGQANALRALIKAEQDRGSDFLRLANALSALYPTGSEEKRLLDAMLLAVPR